MYRLNIDWTPVHYRTIDLVLGPSTALYRSFLEHCTLKNKAIGSIWRDLSKSHKWRQGPDPRPLWLLVGTPSVLGPELASGWADHSLLWWMSLYIFDILFLSPNMCVSWFWWPLRFGWLLVLGLYKGYYLQNFKCVSTKAYWCPQRRNNANERRKNANKGERTRIWNA